MYLPIREYPSEQSECPLRFKWYSDTVSVLLPQYLCWCVLWMRMVWSLSNKGYTLLIYIYIVNAFFVIYIGFDLIYIFPSSHCHREDKYSIEIPSPTVGQKGKVMGKLIPWKVIMYCSFTWYGHCIVSYMLASFPTPLHVLTECSQKAGAGAQWRGEHCTSPENCQNGQSGVEWGLVECCVINMQHTHNYG